MQDQFSDACLGPNFPCLRMVHSKVERASQVELVHHVNAVMYDDFCSNRTESICLCLGSTTSSLTKPSRGTALGHQGKISIVTLPGAVLLARGLGSLAAIKLQR